MEKENKDVLFKMLSASYGLQYQSVHLGAPICYLTPPLLHQLISFTFPSTALRNVSCLARDPSKNVSFYSPEINLFDYTARTLSNCCQAERFAPVRGTIGRFPEAMGLVTGDATRRGIRRPRCVLRQWRLFLKRW